MQTSIIITYRKTKKGPSRSVAYRSPRSRAAASSSRVGARGMHMRTLITIGLIIAKSLAASPSPSSPAVDDMDMNSTRLCSDDWKDLRTHN